MIPGLQIDSGTMGAKFRDSLLRIVASTHSSGEIFDRFVEVLGRMTQLDRCELSHLVTSSTDVRWTAKILHVHCSYATQFLKAGRVVSLSDEQCQAIMTGQAIRISDLLEKPASVSPDLLAEGIRS